MTILGDATFDEYAKSSTPLVIKFFSLWDGASRSFEDMFFAISDEFSSKAVFMQSNINSNPDLAQKVGASKVPTVFVFKNGIPIAKFSNFPSKRAFKEELLAVL